MAPCLMQFTVQESKVPIIRTSGATGWDANTVAVMPIGSASRFMALVYCVCPIAIQMWHFPPCKDEGGQLCDVVVGGGAINGTGQHNTRTALISMLNCSIRPNNGVH